MTFSVLWLWRASRSLRARHTLTRGISRVTITVLKFVGELRVKFNTSPTITIHADHYSFTLLDINYPTGGHFNISAARYFQQTFPRVSSR